jgi:predicted CXXCH cytochrome family protein
VLHWLVAVMVAAGCAAAPSPSPAPSLTPGTASPVVRSNVLRSDYAGSAACEPCHASLHAAFMASPMHRMTRRTERSDMRAPFDGRVFRFKGDSATMDQHEGRRYMRLASRESGSQLFRITKVIGGHYREDFVGQEVQSTAADSAVVHDRHGERIMPVSWLLFTPAWRYKGYSVMVPERDGFKPGMPWRQTCILCHNTAPRLTSLYDDLSPTAAKYQGSVSERFLPSSRTWHYEATDPSKLASAVADEVEFLGGERPEGNLTAVLNAAMRDTRRYFGEEHLVELGIGCEACHNGSKEHTEDPSHHPTFELRSDVVRVRTPAGARAPPTRAEWINRTCARCHTVLFTEYAYTWEGGLRADSPGGSNINSGEARDFLLGGCSDRMACTSCHDPHAGSQPARLDLLGTVAGNGICTGCHERLATPEATARHTHHQPGGVGSACLSCHMPKKNLGLAYRLTRYHRIGSPNDGARVEGDRPLECALCHADRSVETLVTTMERWWGRRFERSRLQELYGALDANPLAATLLHGKPHEQGTAVAALGEHGGHEAVPLIVPQLWNAYPLVRYFARRALEQASGRPVAIDVEQDAVAIQAAAKEWMAGGKPR